MTLDKSNLRRVILDEASQFEEGFKIAEKISVQGSFDRIMVSGMGGSALPSNILRIYLNSLFSQDRSYKKIDVFQNRFYTLPPEAYNNCLNLICSHSGNTEETIASFQEALDNNLPCIGISSGGVIEKMCKKNKILHVKLPVPYKNFQPRMATGHFVGVIIQILINQRMISDCRPDIITAAKKLDKNIPKLEQQGKEMAKRLVGKTPVIYASTHFKALAMIWKIKINENSKTPAFWNYFPELNHNEFVGYTNPQGEFYIILLRDSCDHERNLKRYDVTEKILKENGISVEVVKMPEGTLFYHIFATLALGDWMSYYLALEYKQDPTPVDWVEDFKKELK